MGISNYASEGTMEENSQIPFLGDLAKTTAAESLFITKKRLFLLVLLNFKNLNI